MFAKLVKIIRKAKQNVNFLCNETELKHDTSACTHHSLPVFGQNIG